MSHEPGLHPEPEELELLEQARTAARRAYCPYSRFRVGAALRTAGGRVVLGCNVENASYGLSICAERVALFAARAALAEPEPIVALAVACIDADPRAGPAERMPCGACRQVMVEFLAPETPILVADVGRFTLADLLPHPFQLTPGPARP